MNETIRLLLFGIFNVCVVNEGKTSKVHDLVLWSLLGCVTPTSNIYLATCPFAIGKSSVK